ncbi:MAG: class I SAM-dependent methyltransferase [Carboxylicivirga sp.]|jgi:SAM-dependent methyltransferase|nr:class I SAM-dependent methyltransferase [Carboxylicivirga sp.]
MAFYSKIVEAYDAIFPLNPKQLEFVQQACTGALASKNILDIGCGTGSLSIAMARQSARVRAFDYDKEMVAKANEKRPQALDLQFKQGDMRRVEEAYPSLQFDAALCFGNTLVHLADEKEVALFFQKVAGLLKPEGKFLFQVVNYDRIIAEKLDHLPTIKKDGYTFVRDYYQRKDGRIDFNTTLKGEGFTPIDSSVPLLPLRKSQLEKLLKSHFSSLSFYGAFDCRAWHKETFHCVVEAVK